MGGWTDSYLLKKLRSDVGGCHDRARQNGELDGVATTVFVLLLYVLLKAGGASSTIELHKAKVCNFSLIHFLSTWYVVQEAFIPSFQDTFCRAECVTFSWHHL